MDKLRDKKVAVLLCDGFEEVEMTKPREALEKEGAKVELISPNSKVKSWRHTEWGREFDVDVKLEDANPDDYDALLLPGGVMNPDMLRTYEKAVQFVKKFLDEDKPSAAICHGPWTLIETGKIKNRNLTSYHSIKTDLKNAGANWQDKEVVVDGNLVTSRKPDDIPAFNEKIIRVFSGNRV